MKLLTATFVILAVTAIVIHGAPAENKSLGGTESKFLGQPFDEVVVESTLNVKRKSDTRQSRKQGSEIKRAKRQHGSRNSFPFPNFEEGSSAQAAAQAQSHRAESPFGAFGASASGSQTQSLSFGPGGVVGSASFSGTQKYILPNGQTLDVSFGNAVGGAGSNTVGGAVVSVKGPLRHRN
ncbi:uncharacterized protein LOC132706200 isoform X2 [Cylas formicarius]|uniref:uncharacterized protein LOC132706200 isoform X2 n=1 Tax=Cylas formicarius TaxID=197179 RepID=UPI002958AEFC|nr:uncharacterized protein LOC132706200 isoform X2 [Cylas formicarius]